MVLDLVPAGGPARDFLAAAAPVQAPKMTR